MDSWSINSDKIIPTKLSKAKGFSMSASQQKTRLRKSLSKRKRLTAPCFSCFNRWVALAQGNQILFKNREILSRLQNEYERMCEASDAMRLPSNVLKVSSILKNWNICLTMPSKTFRTNNRPPYTSEDYGPFGNLDLIRLEFFIWNPLVLLWSEGTLLKFQNKILWKASKSKKF